MAAHFARLDKDQNGQVTKEEYVGLYLAGFDRKDKYNDRLLTADEFPHPTSLRIAPVSVGEANRNLFGLSEKTSRLPGHAFYNRQ